MPRVVPSDVVRFINSVWPEEHTRRDVSKSQDVAVAGLLDLTNHLPDELLVVDSAEYAEFICAKAHIRMRLSAWTNDPKGPGSLDYMRGMQDQAPVEVVRRVLAKCPDSHPAADTAELEFIADSGLRAALRVDIADANLALSNGEWKAATILSGSVIEAVLYWFLQREPPDTLDRAIAAVNLRESQQVPKPKPKERKLAARLEWWTLEQFIDIAQELRGITESTARQAHLAREFRNLIHPAKVQRLRLSCNRPTALSAVAALEHVIVDLSAPRSAR